MLFEMRCYRRLIGITWSHELLNETVKQKIRDLLGEYETLLESANRNEFEGVCHGVARGARGPWPLPKLLVNVFSPINLCCYVILVCK